MPTPFTTGMPPPASTCEVADVFTVTFVPSCVAVMAKYGPMIFMPWIVQPFWPMTRYVPVIAVLGRSNDASFENEKHPTAWPNIGHTLSPGQPAQLLPCGPPAPLYSSALNW